MLPAKHLMQLDTKVHDTETQPDHSLQLARMTFVEDSIFKTAEEHECTKGSIKDRSSACTRGRKCCT